MWRSLGSLEINGDPPDLAGRVCERLVFSEYRYNGALEDTAHQTFLRFDGIWHLLYFDCGMIFWRTDEDGPTPVAWSEDGSDFDFSVVDLGNEFGVVGVQLVGYDMDIRLGETAVTFRFDNGVTFSAINDPGSDRSRREILPR